MHAPSAPSARLDWLVWGKAPLPQVAERLIDAAVAELVDRCGEPSGHPGEVNLLSQLVVLPGRRAATSLLWHLSECAERRGVQWVPPRVATPGTIVDVLSPPQARVATAFERELALFDALAVVAPRQPDTMRAMALGNPEVARSVAALVRELEDELHGAGRSLASARDLAAPTDATRWTLICAAAARAESVLRDAGLWLPWSVQRAVAGTAEGITRVTLALIVELPAHAREVLRQLSDGRGATTPVAAMAHAPSDARHAFDGLGLLRPGAWPQRDEGLALPSIVVTDGATDAAQETIRSLLAASISHSADEIVIGVVDQQFGPTLEVASRWAEVPLRFAGGGRITDTQVWSFLEALASVLTGAGASALVERGERMGTPAEWGESVNGLLRLPLVAEWLVHAGALRHAADSAAIADTMWMAEPEVAREAGAEIDAARKIAAAIEQVVAPLRDAPRRIVDWAEPLRGVLAEVLQFGELEEAEQAAAEAIGDELADWGLLPPSVGHARVPAVEALALLAARTASCTIPAPVRRDAIETLGWLELHADDSPVLLLLGMHEGAAPQRSAPHPLLTPRIRTALGLPDEASRAARDAYLFDAMLQGRRAATAIVARRSPGLDPVVPSRLLLRGPREQLAARVMRLVGEPTARRRELPRGMPRPALRSAFAVPAPIPNPALESMRVTDFSAYLACAYRFWLSRVLRLETFAASTGELDASGFGTLVHGVLADFGADATARESSDAGRIGRFLHDRLADRIDREHGAAPSVAVLVQVDRIRERLDAFARWQASHRNEGWRIDRVEWSLPAEAALEIVAEGALPAQQPMRLRGRIDRIDRHERDGLLLIDYKTSAAGEHPRRVHLGAVRADGCDPDAWCDLQLPLYRHLLERTESTRVTIATGYVQLPKAIGSTGLALLELGDHEFETALDVARRVVRAIRAGEFPISSDYGGHDDFAAICHANAFVADHSDSGDGDEEGWS